MREDICIAMKSWRWIVMAAKLALILSIYLSKRSHYLSNIVLKLQGPSLNTKFVSFSTVNPNGNDHLTWKIDCLFSREPLFWLELYFRCANITAQWNLANKNFLCPAFRDMCEKVYGTRSFFFAKIIFVSFADICACKISSQIGCKMISEKIKLKVVIFHLEIVCFHRVRM